MLLLLLFYVEGLGGLGKWYAFVCYVFLFSFFFLLFFFNEKEYANCSLHPTLGRQRELVITSYCAFSASVESKEASVSSLSWPRYPLFSRWWYRGLDV